MNKKTDQYTKILASISEEFVIHLDDVRSLFQEERVKTNFRLLNKGIFKINSIKSNPPKLLSLNFISDVSTKVSRNKSLLNGGFSSDGSDFIDQDVFFGRNKQGSDLKRVKDNSEIRWKFLERNQSEDLSNKMSNSNLNGEWRLTRDTSLLQGESFNLGNSFNLGSTSGALKDDYSLNAIFKNGNSFFLKNSQKSIKSISRITKQNILPKFN